jgi:ubiquitin-conjugating enzyme E2 D/E
MNNFTNNPRVNKDIQDIDKYGPENGISIIQLKQNKFIASIDGPDGTPYSNRKFKFSIELIDYPMKPPIIRAMNIIYHPNIISTEDFPEVERPFGAICMNILKNDWSPVNKLRLVLLAIKELLANPNPEDPMEPEIAELYVNNRLQYDINAKNTI